MQIHIDNIKVSKKQKRKVDPNKVDKHRKSFESGEDVMAIDVVEIEDGIYNICGNGRHRYFGAIEAGFTWIECNKLN